MAVRVDLNGIKNALQDIFSLANTTTASPIDLSSNLSNSKRVQQILTLNPTMMIPQASIFPLVTVYVAEKPIELTTISINQLQGKRRAKVMMKVVGSVWNDNIATFDDDPADDDVNYLMENIELILRNDSTLESTVNWHRPIDCKYFTDILDEQSHLRSGVLTLECDVYY